MQTVSTFRLYVLRGAYLLLVVGLGSIIWPSIVDPPADFGQMWSATHALLGALSLLALVGIRYPLQMLPLLLFEIAWKVIWVVAFGLPLLLAGQLTGAMRETWNNCLFGIVVFPLVIPWGYVYHNYVKRRGDRWMHRARTDFGITDSSPQLPVQ